MHALVCRPNRKNVLRNLREFLSLLAVSRERYFGLRLDASGQVQDQLLARLHSEACPRGLPTYQCAAEAKEECIFGQICR